MTKMNKEKQRIAKESLRAVELRLVEIRLALATVKDENSWPRPVTSKDEAYWENQARKLRNQLASAQELTS